jgi:hypothetical protein
MVSAMETTKTTVYLDRDDYRRLRQLAKVRGTTAAHLVREAVALYARQGAAPLRPRSIGAGRSGDPTLAARAEELLDGLGEA